MIDKSNFFINTFVIFNGCKLPKRNPDFISEGGSEYWYGKNKKGDFVIRSSNHWMDYFELNKRSYRQCNKIASCKWSIRFNKRNTNAGKAYFKDFRLRATN